MEVRSDLDEDINNSSTAIADKMRESLKSYSNDLFKELREGLNTSLNKVTQTIENCLNKTKSDLKAYVEEMKAIAKNAKFEMPVINSEEDVKPMKSVSQKANSIRGPPSSKIKMPTVDLSNNANVIKAQINDSISQMSILNSTIKSQENELDTLAAKYQEIGKSIAKRNDIKNSLGTQKEYIDSIKESIEEFKKKPIEFRLNNVEVLDDLKNKLEAAKKEYQEILKNFDQDSIELEQNIKIQRKNIAQIKTVYNW